MMSASENNLFDNSISVSGNGIEGGSNENVSVELSESDFWNSDNSDNIALLVENTTELVEYCRKADKTISNIEQASIFVLVACGLVFGAICALILDRHLSSGVK